MTPTPELLTTDEVAAALKVSVPTVWRWVRDHRIEHIRLPGSQLRFRREDIEAILRGETPASAA